MILLVASNKDIASLNIKKQILNNYPFKKTAESFQQNPIYTANINGKDITLVTLNQESVNAQNLPECFPECKTNRLYLKTQQRKWQTNIICSHSWKLC